MMQRYHTLLMIGLFIFLFVLPVILAEPESVHFEDSADFPLMGDWEGSLIRPDVDARYNILAAQLICIDKTKYRLKILPALYKRAEPYLDVEVEINGGRLIYKSHGWDMVFDKGICRGIRDPHGKPVKFELKKVENLSPTLGLNPPKGAIVLFDGTGFEAWRHHGGKNPVTWTLLKSGVMETVSGHWNNYENRQKGIGGSIITKQSFKNIQFHMEFRYPVEPGKVGQKRGNSGLKFSGFKEVQILNSYGLNGYWNECGALYRYMPPHVNAAAPPLQWQTYDVEILLPKNNSDDTTGFMTVKHNGLLIHSRVPVDIGQRDSVTISLQDHRNTLQFRNIWVKEISSELQ